MVPFIDRSSISLSVAPVNTSLALSAFPRPLPCVFMLLSLAGVAWLLAGDSVIRLLFVSIYATDSFASPILAWALAKSVGLPIAPDAFLLFVILIFPRETGVKLGIELNIVLPPLKDILPFIDSDPVALTGCKGDLSLADYLTLSFSLLRLGYFTSNALCFPLQAPHLHFASISVFGHSAER